jgi:hypothetical protein
MMIMKKSKINNFPTPTKEIEAIIKKLYLAIPPIYSLGYKRGFAAGRKSLEKNKKAKDY